MPKLKPAKQAPINLPTNTTPYVFHGLLLGLAIAAMLFVVWSAGHKDIDCGEKSDERPKNAAGP